MRITLLLPGTVVPADFAIALAQPLQASGWPARLARAELMEHDGGAAPAPHLAWLGARLFHQTAAVATAPYALAALSGNAPAAGEFVWHADPIHLELARDHLLLTPLPKALASLEAKALIDSIDACARHHDVELFSAADRWFLRSSRRWEIQPQPLDAVLGQPLYDVMPQGERASAWNRLLNEIQMTWHEHEVNEAREARGEPSVNSLWLHGGGQWSPLPRSGFSAIHADAAELQGAALASNVPFDGRDARPVDRALIVWPEALRPRLAGDWDGWLGAMRALDQRIATLAAAELELVLTGARQARTFRVRSSDRIKFWKMRALEKALSE